VARYEIFCEFLVAPRCCSLVGAYLTVMGAYLTVNSQLRAAQKLRGRPGCSTRRHLRVRRRCKALQPRSILGSYRSRGQASRYLHRSTHRCFHR
jgi:hypothetical protein